MYVFILGISNSRTICLVFLARCCFSDRGEKVSMSHSKEIRIGFINICYPHIGSKGRGWVVP